VTTATNDPLRALAFYLPQYHRDPANDRWWGPGYTDWRRVLAARPRFPGHRQPRRPGELGAYDLLDPPTLPAQAELAAEHRVDGFIYYHYWSAGRRLLHAPMEALLRRRSVRLPFAVCWANESWTDVWGPTYGSDPARWTGTRRLFEQHYSPADDAEHFRHLAGISATTGTSASTAGRCCSSGAPPTCPAPRPPATPGAPKATVTASASSTCAAWNDPATGNTCWPALRMPMGEALVVPMWVAWESPTGWFPWGFGW